ncbi:MAG: histidine phosphatase family protein [Fibrobacteria bacterium]|nr:histidine phosphatase family protein [Fibrobacteria bacterium]
MAETPFLLRMMRHGEAGASLDLEWQDHLRSLTQEGTAQVRRVAILVSHWKPGVDRILCSPWQRGVETGRILAEVLGVPLISHPWLTGTQDTPKRFFARLMNESSRGYPLFVGHEPSLSSIQPQLMEALPKVWPKGAVFEFSREDQRWTLRDRILPDLLSVP